MMGTSLRCLLASALFCLAGCTANIMDSDARPWTATDVQGRPVPGVGVQGAAGSAALGSGAPGATAAGSSAPAAAGSCDTERLGARAVLLAPRQYVNVLRDVLGPKVVSDQDAAASSVSAAIRTSRPLFRASMLSPVFGLYCAALSSLLLR